MTGPVTPRPAALELTLVLSRRDRALLTEIRRRVGVATDAAAVNIALWRLAEHVGIEDLSVTDFELERVRNGSRAKGRS